ncbi:MAG TPA: NADH-quinone oxidoreductase subunit NuoF [Candidatus Dormibacteraeota bacterium]|nr:NADH-quinone oxidoreductase subunit NuoF [Candidatus Dormibacteraeota bacterium]
MPTYEPVLTKGIGELDLTDIGVYRKQGGYEQLRRAVREMEPDGVVDAVMKSNLRGRGGAGFPTGRKWSFLPKDGRPRYLVCNCDEAEPGTFKDRMLLEFTPHQIIEGIMASAYAIRAARAFIYIRGEMLEGYGIFTRSLAQARAAGMVGEKICGGEWSCELVVHRGAGAYICGEETGLLNSLEGKRGEPRLKPPFPANAGLYDMPTVVNNVETLAFVPHILARGAEWFASIGPVKSPGLKIVSISGHVRKPGNYEVPLGVTIRELIFEHAGGLFDGRKVKAVQPGGGSSACLFEEHLDVAYDFDSIAAAGSMLGSGAMVVMDDTTDMLEAAFVLQRFYAHESCGQCTPCREGTHWSEAMLERLLEGHGRKIDVDLLTTVGDKIAGHSLCALGDASVPFLQSAIKRFPEEFLRGAERIPEVSLLGTTAAKLAAATR